MSTWKYADIENNSPSLAAYVYGEATEFTLTYSNDAGRLAHCYLAVADTALAGVLSARRVGDTSWLPIMAPSDATCYLGTVPDGDLVLEFKLSNNTDLDAAGLISIPVVLYHDAGASPPCRLFLDEWWDDCLFWGGCYSYEFWRDDYAPAPIVCGLSGSERPFPELDPDAPQWSDSEVVGGWS
jgi:hypothetical protein